MNYLKEYLKHLIKERIVHSGNSWLVKPKIGNKVLGTHRTKKEAIRQLAAIEISKRKRN